MSKASPNEVKKILEAARGKTIVVAGDLMLDEWIIGTASRISPEAPVPVVRFAERRTAPGAAANAAMNLLSLGLQVRVVGVIGNDNAGDDLIRELSEAGAVTEGIVKDASRPTILKTRIVAQSQQQLQQMVRVDRESELPLSSETVNDLESALKAACDGADLLCVSDYDKGLVSSGVLSSVIEASAASQLIVTGGPKPFNAGLFRGANFLSLNQYEASALCQVKLTSEEVIASAGETLRERLGVRALAITLSSRGARLFEQGQELQVIRPHLVEVFDGTGAGDTFLSASTVAIAGGANYALACEIGNLAAAASVRHAGVVAVKPEEVIRIAAEANEKAEA